jgi:hypothetical protein
MVDANNNAVGSVPANGHGHGHGPLFGLLPALPYLALIVLGLIGVSWTSISSAPSTTYWGMLTPVAAFTCIAARRCGWLVNASDMRRLLNVDAKANPVDADCLRRLHIRIVPARLGSCAWWQRFSRSPCQSSPGSNRERCSYLLSPAGSRSDLRLVGEGTPTRDGWMHWSRALGGRLDAFRR